MKTDTEKIALVLGGGGSRGAYEIGVWQALRELDIKIDIVTGTSVGAINGAMIVQDDFEPAEKLWKELETNMIFDVDIKEILTQRGVDNKGLRQLLDEYVSEDRIRASSIDYGIVTAQLPSFTPHYLFKESIPNSKMRDYILASASCFLSHAIDDLSFVDGGYIDNLPVGMALEKGAKLVIAVDLDGVGYVNKKALVETEYLKIIESCWNLGNFLVFDKNNTRRIIRLGYLDAMKAFKVFDGFYFTFPKDEFDKRTLKNADSAAKIFDLDPLRIYKSFTLNRRLADAVKETLAESNGTKKTSGSLYKGKLVENITRLSKTMNKKALTITIAKSLEDAPDTKNFFLSKPALKYLNDEIRAASYLIANKMV